MRKITMELLHEALDEADEKELELLDRLQAALEMPSDESLQRLGLGIAYAVNEYARKLDRLDQERHGPDDGDSLAEEKRLDDLNRARDIQAQMRELYRGDDGEE